MIKFTKSLAPMTQGFHRCYFYVHADMRMHTHAMLQQRRSCAYLQVPEPQEAIRGL